LETIPQPARGKRQIAGRLYRSDPLQLLPQKGKGFFPGTTALMEALQCADTVSRHLVILLQKVFNK
jgi:hypothetical protein